MSKPDKPGELQDVKVEAISLVGKAANRERFKVFKSAEEEPPVKNEEAEAPEIIEKNERGLFHTLKKFFTGEEVEKGAVADIVNTQDKGRKLGQAMDALFAILGTNRWGDGDTKIETNASKIRAALNDFKSVAESILIGSDEEVTKAVAELEKSGRKISGSRLSKLKNIQSMLNDVLSGLEENQEVKQMTSEEVTKAVEEAIKPLNERIEKLEQEEKPAEAPNAPEQPKEADVGEVVKNAINEAIAPLTARIEKIENARGFSNRVPEDTKLEKSENLWAGIF